LYTKFDDNSIDKLSGFPLGDVNVISFEFSIIFFLNSFFENNIFAVSNFDWEKLLFILL
jgi:hypothetical protein